MMHWFVAKIPAVGMHCRIQNMKLEYSCTNAVRSAGYRYNQEEGNMLSSAENCERLTTSQYSSTIWNKTICLCGIDILEVK